MTPQQMQDMIDNCTRVIEGMGRRDGLPALSKSVSPAHLESTSDPQQGSGGDRGLAPMTLEEWREMVEAIAVLQRDVKENKQEISDLGYRVFQLERANWPKPQEPPRFQAGYGDGGKG